MPKHMNKKFNLLIVTFLAICLYSCVSGTTYSSPEFSEDFSKVKDEVKALSNAESVDFVDIRTTNWKDVPVERELRIDLVKPKQFPSDEDLKRIILAVKPKLIESAKFTKYTVTEVEGQHGNATVFPAENILKSVTVKTEDL